MMPGFYTTWKVGVSPWAGLRQECLTVKLDNCEPGMEMKILQSIASLLKVKLDFVESQISGCGDQLTNGTWTGLMGMLQAGEIDIIGNLCALLEDKMQLNFANFSYPVIQDSQYFLIRLPKPSYKFELSAPFELPLWGTVVGFWLLFLCLYIVALNVYCQLPMRNSLKLTTREMYHSLTGCDNQRVPIPILWNIWTIYLGLILMLYSLFITAALCRPIAINKPFSNNIELSEKIFSGEYKVITYKDYPVLKIDSSSQYLFEEGISRHGFVRIQQAETHQQLNHLLDLLNNSMENLVFISSKSLIYFRLDGWRDPSKFWLIKDEFLSDTLAVYFYRKGFKMRKLLDYAITLIGDYKYNVQGLNNWYLKEVREGNQIGEKPPEKLIIDLKLMKGPFMLYFCFIGISILIALLEIIIHWLNRKVNFFSW